MSLSRDVFQAIAASTRSAVLLLATTPSMRAGAIASSLDAAGPTVSKHLPILAACELLRQEKQGRTMYYHFNPKQ